MKKILLFASAAALLASCSKDLTEDVAAPAIKGSNKIVASYEVNAATRTHFDGKELAWDNGDAIGVFAQAENEDTNAYFGYDGSGFTGDLMSVAGNSFVVYYPWERGKEIKNGKIDFEIPAAQHYNHNYEGEYGSFAAGMVPAIAQAQLEGEKTKTSVLEDVKMLPLVSYLSLPIRGQGTVKQVKLEINDAEGSSKALAGTITVDLTEDDEENGTLFTIDDSAAKTNAITLKCGDGVTLKGDEPVYFMFVIPAEFELKGAVEYKLTVNDDKQAMSFKRAATAADRTIARNEGLRVASADFYWIEGAEGAYVISTPEQFLEYAYAATKGVDAVVELLGEDKHDMIAYATTNTLKKAIFAKDIDFTGFEVSNDHSDYEGDEPKYNKFQEAVFYKWYNQENGEAIETIGGGAPFSIDGKEYALIGLTVKGNGVFYEGDRTPENVSKAVNLTLAGVTVDATEVEDLATASFLIARLRSGDVADPSTIIENITVSADCKFEAAEDVKKVLIGKVHAGGDEVSFEEAEITNLSDIQFAGHLNVMGDLTFDENMSVDEFNTILVNRWSDAYGNGTAVVTLADEAAARAFIVKEGVARYATELTDDMDGGAANASVYYSVMGGNTSYWTATTATTADNGDGILTAEELAYVAANGGNVKLTNNIDLGYNTNNGKYFGVKMDVVWKTGATAVIIDGANKTISRARVATGLFGETATVSNVKLSSAFVDGAYLLAETGTATKVTASNINYKDAKAIDGILAGLFYEANINGVIPNAATKVAGTTNNSIVATNLPEEATFGAIYGVLNVDLGHNYTFTSANAFDATSVGLFNCYVDVHTNHLNTTEIKYAGESVPDAETVIKWDYTNQPIPAEYTVYILKASETKTTNYKKYDGTLSDLASVVAAAAQGGDVVFANNLEGEVSNTGRAAISQNGGVIDGNGKTLSVNDTCTDNEGGHGISTTGGTIKNLTVEGAFRAVKVNATADVTIEDCVLTGGYALNTGSGNGQATLTVKNTTLKGWSSWAQLKAANFTDCTFAVGSWYTPAENVYNRVVKPYINTTFKNCHFNKLSYLDLSELINGQTVTFDGCDVDGVKITDKNIVELFETIETATVEKVTDVSALTGKVIVK